MFETRYLYDIHPIQSNRPQRLLDVLRYLLLFCAGGFAALYGAVNGWALPTIEQLMPSNEQLEMVVNKSSLVRLNHAVTRVSIVAPDIADVQIMDDKEILLTAQSVGETSLIMWLEDGSVRTADVIVRYNTRQISEAIQHTMPDEAIEVMPMSQGVALRGQVQGIDRVGQAMEIASSYTPQVVNLLNAPGVHQVLLKVRIAEVARTFREETGVNFQILDNNFQGTSMLGGLVSGNLDQPGLTVSDAVTMFMGIPNSNINAFIQALEEKGMMRILAEPNLVARSGETASFLAGGEFPIPIVQGGASGNSITVEYKEFGVRLQFTPTVLDVENVRLDISPEVSDLDFAQGVRVGGFFVPTLITRRAHTVVTLMDGQSFAIAGLISKTKQKNRRKVPIVGDIPIFGGLFRGGDISEKETELLIMVTPHLVSPLFNGASQIMPGEEIKDEVKPFIQEDEEILHPEPADSGSIESDEMRDEGVPVIHPVQSTSAKGSKVRSIRSAKASWKPVERYRLEEKEETKDEPVQTVSKSDVQSEPELSVVSPSNTAAEKTEEPNIAEPKIESISPVKRADVVPAELPKPKKKAPRQSSPTAPYSAVISQSQYTKPGMAPVQTYQERTEAIASYGMGKYRSQKPSSTKPVIPSIEKAIIVASRIESN